VTASDDCAGSRPEVLLRELNIGCCARRYGRSINNCSISRIVGQRVGPRAATAPCLGLMHAYASSAFCDKGLGFHRVLV
jgi:hypothetical protein